jgi:putative membrane protein
VKYLLIFLLVLAIFVISVTLGAQNDQQVTFNYLLAQGEYRVSSLLASYLLPVLPLAGWFAVCSG